MSQLAVVIVNWNAGSMLGASVRSLLSTSDAEIVIVDNASTDGSLDDVNGAGGRIHVVRNSRNVGFAGGVNRGFEETRTPYVLILNPDVRATPGAIDALKSVLDSNPRAGAVGGFVNNRYLPRRFPTRVSLVRENLGLARRRGNKASELARVDQPAGSALMVRREAFEAVGGFDEQFYPAWFEDVDFSKALAASGWEAWFEPAASFDHDGGYSLETMGTERFMAAYYTNQLRYVRKHLGEGLVPVLKAALLVGVVVRSLLRPRQFGGYWRGLLQVMAA
jgi:GT2 family glycosyltransferase